MESWGLFHDFAPSGETIVTYREEGSVKIIAEKEN